MSLLRINTNEVTKKIFLFHSNNIKTHVKYIQNTYKVFINNY